jgi:2-dehydro-3-deoxygalactonokinase
MYSLEPLLFCVDMGTTRTRAWVTKGETVWSHLAADFGVRDIAGGRSREWLRFKLIEVLQQTQELAERSGCPEFPEAIVAAGMITSNQGLVPLDHLDAPADVKHFYPRLFVEQLHGFHDLPLVVVPGLRTLVKPTEQSLTSIVDLMRGEETLCLGLVELELLNTRTALWHLGSHWKWIWFDDKHRIAGSRTALTGEMIHAIQANTLLASALPQHKPLALDPTWLDLGFDEATCSGLGRAMFCLRLLEQDRQSTADQRLSFLYGAFIQSEAVHVEQVLTACGAEAVLIAGDAPLAAAWDRMLCKRGIESSILNESEKVHAFLTGLRSLYKGAQQTRQLPK